jgi:hypothetical protein
MTNIKIFYHIFCNQNTESIVLDQAKKIIWSGLYKKSHKIYCFLSGEEIFIEKLTYIISNFGNKFIIAKKGVNDTTFERFTLLSIKDYIDDNDKILYIHSKGVMRSILNPEFSEGIIHWRNFMEYYLIYKHNDCIDLLDNYDTVGVNYGSSNTPKHYSGNFWWSTAKYFLTLDNYIGDGPCDPEFYLCQKTDKNYEIARNTNAIYSSNVFFNQYIDSA